MGTVYVLQEVKSKRYFSDDSEKKILRKHISRAKRFLSKGTICFTLEEEAKLRGKTFEILEIMDV